MKKYTVSVRLKDEISHSGFTFSKRKHAESFIRSLYFMNNYRGYTFTKIAGTVQEELKCRSSSKKE